MNIDLLIIPFFICLILFTYVKYNYSDYLNLVLFSAINYQYSLLLLKENKNNKPKSFYFLQIIFFLSVGVFVVALLKKFYPDLFSNYLGLIIPVTIIILLLLISLNMLINFITGKIFLQDDIRLEYNNNINTFNQLLGIILFPINILVFYTNAMDIFIYIGISSFCLIYLFKIIRLFKINFSKQLNIFYMFLYLCTLEIIPLMYGIKLIAYI